MLKNTIIIIALAIIAIYLFIPSGWPVAPGKSRWQNWFDPQPLSTRQQLRKGGINTSRSNLDEYARQGKRPL